MPYKAWLIAWRRQIWPLHLAIFTFAIFAFYLGSVDVHRVLITDAASETNAVKLSSVLQ